MFERLGMRVDLAELGTAYTGKGLAGRSADKHVNGRGNRAKAEFGDNGLRRQYGYIAGPAVPGIATMEIAAMRRCGIGIQLDGSGKLKARSVKAKGEPPTAGKQVKHAWTASG
jgi:hypothetical protein